MRGTKGKLCLCLLSVAFITVLRCRVQLVKRPHPRNRLVFNTPDDFKGFDNVSGTSDGCYIVPNIVHFIRFGQKIFTFIDAVCVLAALKNQRPDKIYFHTDTPQFRGRYWEVILSTPGIEGVIEIKNMSIPKRVFGQNYNSGGWGKYHASDVTRLRVLMMYGGIYLDNDSYIVRCLNEFRKFEMTVSWEDKDVVKTQLGNQVIIAHKNARFLREWLLTYRDAYDPKKWYYNGGIRPVEVVLSKYPELVHRASRRFAEYPGIGRILYLLNDGAWLDHYAIHLFINHMKTLVSRNLSSVATYPVVFNEHNIRFYNANIRQMVYDVYPINRSRPNQYT